MTRADIALRACEGISTHALQYGVIPQLIYACELAHAYLRTASGLDRASRDYELLVSRLSLMLAKIQDPEPEDQP